MIKVMGKTGKRYSLSEYITWQRRQLVKKNSIVQDKKSLDIINCGGE